MHQGVPRFEGGVRQSTLADEQYISSRGPLEASPPDLSAKDLWRVKCIFVIASNKTMIKGNSCKNFRSLRGSWNLS